MPPLDFIAYGLLPWYPHMGPADAAIWARYVAANPKAFEAVAYDVPVGAGAEFDVTAGGILGPGIKKLYQRKIDVLGRTPSGLVLVEVKPRATTAALGQLRGYKTLFERDYPAESIAGLLIVTDSLMPEMEFLAQGEGVALAVA